MSTSRVLKWVSSGSELLLAIPILGGSLVIGLWYVPLALMLGLHIATLIISSRENVPKHGSILGIVTSCVAWIPFLGWLLHLVTGILLAVDAAKKVETPLAS